MTKKKNKKADPRPVPAWMNNKQKNKAYKDARASAAEAAYFERMMRRYGNMFFGMEI